MLQGGAETSSALCIGLLYTVSGKKGAHFHDVRCLTVMTSLSHSVSKLCVAVEYSFLLPTVQKYKNDQEVQELQSKKVVLFPDVVYIKSMLLSTIWYTKNVTTCYMLQSVCSFEMVES